MGQSVNIGNRKRTHFHLLNNQRHFNPYLQSSFNKYGIENFIFEILEKCDINYLNERECYWMNLLNTNNREYGYNLRTVDQEGNSLLSEETKKKISESHKGIGHTIETRLKLSLVNKGRKASDKTKLKMSLTRKERKIKISDQQKQRLSELNKSRTGKYKQETLDKMSLSKSKPVLQYSVDDIFIREFKSISEAHLITGIAISGISFCSLGKRKTAGKYKWKFKIKTI